MIKAGAVTIGRDAASGRVTTKTVGNLRETFSYSKYGELARQRVERLSSGGSVVETLYEAIYEDGGLNGARDAMGRIVKKTERIVSGDTPTSGARPLDSKVYDYGYNQAGRPWLESVAVNGTVINSYQYDSNGHDPLTGLVRFGARDYSPEVGRRTARDPVRLGGGENSWAYLRGNPMNGIDPQGLQEAGTCGYAAKSYLDTCIDACPWWWFGCAKACGAETQELLKRCNDRQNEIPKGHCYEDACMSGDCEAGNAG